MVFPIPKAVQEGRWFWPKDSDADARQETARALARDKSNPRAFAALDDCLSTAHEPDTEVRVACAEGLLSSDPKKGLASLQRAVKLTITTITPKMKDVFGHLPLLEWRGRLTGILLLHGTQRHDAGLVRSAEKYLFGKTPDDNIVRSSMHAYLLDHPLPELEPYAIWGLRGDQMTRNTTAHLLAKWPYSTGLLNAMLGAYDVSPANQELFLRAFWRMCEKNLPELKKNSKDFGRLTTLLSREVGLLETEPAAKDLEIRRWAAIVLHICLSDEEKVVTHVRPIFEDAIKDETAGPFIERISRARLNQISSEEIREYR